MVRSCRTNRDRPGGRAEPEPRPSSPGQRTTGAGDEPAGIKKLDEVGGQHAPGGGAKLGELPLHDDRRQLQPEAGTRMAIATNARMRRRTMVSLRLGTGRPCRAVGLGPHRAVRPVH